MKLGEILTEGRVYPQLEQITARVWAKFLLSADTRGIDLDWLERDWGLSRGRVDLALVQQRLDFWRKHFLDLFQRSPVMIYRGVLVGPKQRNWVFNPIAKQTQHQSYDPAIGPLGRPYVGVGISWTTDLTWAKAEKDRGVPNYIMMAQVNSTNVDWLATLALAVVNSHAKKEIRLRPKTPLILRAVVPYNGSLNQLGKPIPLNKVYPA